MLNSSISLVLTFSSTKKEESNEKTHLWDFAFVTQTSALHTSESDGIEEARDREASTVNEAWKTATSHSKECSQCLNLEKQHGSEKEGV